MAKQKQNRIEKEKQQQLTSEREVVIQQALLFSRKRFKKFDEIILQLYRKEDLSFSFSDRRIWKINECFNTFSSKATSAERKKLKDVFIQLNTTTELLNTEEDVQAVYNMVLFRAYWRKDFFDWKPFSKQAKQQVKELAAYLFCK